MTLKALNGYFWSSCTMYRDGKLLNILIKFSHFVFRNYQVKQVNETVSVFLSKKQNKNVEILFIKFHGKLNFTLRETLA